MITVTSGIKVTNNAVADPDLELRGDPVFCRLPCRLFFFLRFFLSFFYPNSVWGGGGAPPLPQAPPVDPPLQCMQKKHKILLG